MGFGVDCGVYHWPLSKNNQAKKTGARHYWQSARVKYLKPNTTSLSRLFFAFLQTEQLLNIQQVNLDSPDTVKHSLTHFIGFDPNNHDADDRAGVCGLTQTTTSAANAVMGDDSAQNSLAKPKAMQLLASG